MQVSSKSPIVCKEDHESPSTARVKQVKSLLFIFQMFKFHQTCFQNQYINSSPWNPSIVLCSMFPTFLCAVARCPMKYFHFACFANSNSFIMNCWKIIVTKLSHFWNRVAPSIRHHLLMLCSADAGTLLVVWSTGWQLGCYAAVQKLSRTIKHRPSLNVFVDFFF